MGSTSFAHSSARVEGPLMATTGAVKGRPQGMLSDGIFIISKSGHFVFRNHVIYMFAKFVRETALDDGPSIAK